MAKLTLLEVLREAVELGLLEEENRRKVGNMLRDWAWNPENQAPVPGSGAPECAEHGETLTACVYCIERAGEKAAEAGRQKGVEEGRLLGPKGKDHVCHLCTAAVPAGSQHRCKGAPHA